VSSVVNWAIGLYPIPDAAVENGITIFGYATSVDWADDTSSPAWPASYHEVLAWGACVEAAIRDMERGNPVPEYALRYFSGEYERQKAELRAAMASHMGAKVYRRGAGNRVSDETEMPFAVVMNPSTS